MITRRNISFTAWILITRMRFTPSLPPPCTSRRRPHLIVHRKPCDEVLLPTIFNHIKTSDSHFRYPAPHVHSSDHLSQNVGHGSSVARLNGVHLRAPSQGLSSSPGTWRAPKAVNLPRRSSISDYRYEASTQTIVQTPWTKAFGLYLRNLNVFRGQVVSGRTAAGSEI